MHSTAIDRRRFLALGAGLLGGAGLPVTAWTLPGRLYIGARGSVSGEFGIAAFDAAGNVVLDLAVPVRGHAFALDPVRRRLVAFGRRPARTGWVVDLARGTTVHTVASPPGRHFYGHGVFSPDGRALYATENDFEAGRGVIGVYDASAGFARVAELPSYGTGPHELTLMSDGTTLAVANGGIRTHPDMPRMELNVPTMEPSLAYVDRLDGRLLERVQLAPELHQLSIRHLDVGTGGVVVVAMQYAGPGGDVVPLVAMHRRGQPLRPLEAPAHSLRAMRQYCGSVAFDSAGTTVAISAPRGNLLTFWSAESGALIGAAGVADGCGVTAARETGVFIASSGEGGLFRVDARAGTARRLPASGPDGVRWDNHLVSI